MGFSGDLKVLFQVQVPMTTVYGVAGDYVRTCVLCVSDESKDQCDDAEARGWPSRWNVYCASEVIGPERSLGDRAHYFLRLAVLTLES